MKRLFFNFLKNPFKVFLTASLLKLCLLGVNQTFTVLGLPEILSNENYLTQEQILIGFLLGILRVILSLVSATLSVLFTISLLYFIYRLIKPTTKPSNKQS
jgi:hypothetical protein